MADINRSFSGPSKGQSVASPLGTTGVGNQDLDSNNLTVQAGIMTSWNNQLRECSIQALDGQSTSLGVLTFPVEECAMSFSQDIVQHKKPNVPGALIESMGRNPIIFKLRAPFLTGLQRGTGETWSDLYPQTFISVFQILNADIAPNIDFIHPTLGSFTVKPQNGSAINTTEIRNGQILEFELVESITIKQGLVSNDQYQAAQSAATLFDTSKFTLNPPLPQAITRINLSQLLGQINGLISSTTMGINQLTSGVNHAINQVRTIQNSLNSLKTAATSGLSNQLQTISTGLYSIQYGFKDQGQNISTYTVRVEMTLGAVASIVHNSVSQIIKLNPGLSKIPTLPVGTQVAYYNFDTKHHL